MSESAGQPKTAEIRAFICTGIYCPNWWEQQKARKSALRAALVSNVRICRTARNGGNPRFHLRRYLMSELVRTAKSGGNPRFGPRWYLMSARTKWLNTAIFCVFRARRYLKPRTIDHSRERRKSVDCGCFEPRRYLMSARLVSNVRIWRCVCNRQHRPSRARR